MMWVRVGNDIFKNAFYELALIRRVCFEANGLVLWPVPIKVQEVLLTFSGQ